MPTFTSSTLISVVIIACQSYLIAVVITDLLFDLLGNSDLARTYYCILQPAVSAELTRSFPIISVVLFLSIAMFLKLRDSFRINSDLFLFELCMACAFAVVGAPLYFKLRQLRSIGCQSVSGWYVYRNLLMSHTCVLIILTGSVVAEVFVLFHDLKKKKKKRV